MSPVLYSDIKHWEGDLGWEFCLLPGAQETLASNKHFLALCWFLMGTDTVKTGESGAQGFVVPCCNWFRGLWKSLESAFDGHKIKTDQKCYKTTSISFHHTDNIFDTNVSLSLDIRAFELSVPSSQIFLLEACMEMTYFWNQFKYDT